jgi:hypothetical protein
VNGLGTLKEKLEIEGARSGKVFAK